MEQFEGSEGISEPQDLGEQEFLEGAASSQGGEQVESREGGDELGGAEVVSDRTGLEAPGGGAVQPDGDAGLDESDEPTEPDSSPRRLLGGRGVRGSRSRTRRRVRASDAAGRRQLTASQRMLILDSWMRSKLPANDFASIAGVSPHTLYGWRKRFEEQGPAGLASPQRRRGGGSRLSEPTRRAILMLKQSHPDWGEDRIHDVLMRTEGFGASPGAIGRVLAEGGWVVAEQATRPHAPKVSRFERKRPNELWQTDLFTFILKRENRRVHLVAFLDDYSRFIVGYGLYASASGGLVREAFEASIANFGAPKEVLTDNGTQYYTWRGKSAFTALCERRGIRQIVAKPHNPKTLGKIERFWGTLWRELVEGAIFRGLSEARERIGYFLDHYNFQRPHQGIGGLVPADRYFEAASEVRQTLAARVRANALELAQHGEPRKPFYLTGRVGGKSISLHAEGERVILTHGEGQREEVDLSAPGRRVHEEEPVGSVPLTPQASPPDHPAMHEDPDELAPPASSPLDGILGRLERGLDQPREDDDDEDGSVLALGGVS